MEKVALFAVKITGKLVKKGLIQEEDALLYSYGIENGIWLAALSVVLVLSPVESRNKKLDDVEKKYYKRMSHCIVSIQACFLVLLYCMGMYRYFYAGYTAIIFVALFMVLGKITAKCYT